MNAATKQILLRFYCLQSSLLSAHLGSQCIRMCTRGNVALQILDRIHETRRDMSKSSFTAPREQSYHCYRDGCTGLLRSTYYVQRNPSFDDLLSLPRKSNLFPYFPDQHLFVCKFTVDIAHCYFIAHKQMR